MSLSFLQEPGVKPGPGSATPATIGRGNASTGMRCAQTSLSAPFLLPFPAPLPYNSGVLLRIASILFLLGGRLCAWDLPADWPARAPTPAQITTIMAAADQEGWAAVAPALRTEALRTYEAGQPDAAAEWLGLEHWAALLGESEDHFIHRWFDAEVAAKVNHANMPRSYPAPVTPLAKHASRSLQAWLLADRKFTAKFFGLLSPCDYVPAVLDILDQLHTANPARFQTYAQLALAVAVVYDTPPPPGWPHHQVSAEALPRRLPAPADAFAFFVQADLTGKTLQHLAKLDADVLKFLVDIAAPLPELTWAQQNVRFLLPDLIKSYEAVSYRLDRLESKEDEWPGKTYTLAQILHEGGICVDQAYFAVEAGKARGVPTLLFSGEGVDVRHAWFGYLDGSQHWQLDAARYAEAKLVTGVARDPQTWGILTDHELSYLAEGFRTLPTYQQSRLHTAIALAYMEVNRAPSAVAAARQAANYEHRNVDAWETLLAAQTAAGADAKTREATLREAALALAKYPDLNAQYRQRLADSLRARGEISAADFEERQIARKNADDRSDLAVGEAATTLKRTVANEPLARQMQVFSQLLRQFGPDSGTNFYDEVARPFVLSLHQQGHLSEARSALSQAKTALEPAAGSQLEMEMDQLAETLKP